MLIRKLMVVLAMCAILLTTLSSCGEDAKYGDGKCDNCGRTATYDDGEREMCRNCFNSFVDWLDKQ